MYTVHLHILGRIHDCKCIDSSYLKFWNKKGKAISNLPSHFHLIKTTSFISCTTNNTYQVCAKQEI
jgi:hypothetical protein